MKNRNGRRLGYYFLPPASAASRRAPHGVTFDRLGIPLSLGEQSYKKGEAAAVGGVARDAGTCEGECLSPEEMQWQQDERPPLSIILGPRFLLLHLL